MHFIKLFPKQENLDKNTSACELVSICDSDKGKEMQQSVLNGLKNFGEVSKEVDNIFRKLDSNNTSKPARKC